MTQDLVVALVFIVYAMGTLITFGTLLTWVERKQAAVMSDRIGANRAYIRIPFTQMKLVWWGLFHGIADGIKMLLKENFRRAATTGSPTRSRRGSSSRRCCWCSPSSRSAARSIPGRLIPPLADWFGQRTYPMQIAQLDAGLLVVFAFSGLTVIGAMLAGWSSANKFSLLGGLRAGSQMISYEVVIGLTVLGLIMIFGTIDLGAIVRRQSGTVLGVLPAWGIVYQPLGALLFLTAAIAENKRIPFDLPEAESELIAGYYTEYTSMKMGLFMFAEFIEIAIIGALFTTLFLGGYNLPYMSDAGFAFPGGATVALGHGAGGRDPARHLPRQGDARLQLPDPRPLVAAALPLRPGARVRVEVHAADRARQPHDHGRAAVVAPAEADVKVAYPRKRYWNEPTLTLWERAYLPEIVRGLAITSGGLPAQHGALDDRQERRADDLLPGGDARRLLADQPRQARPDAAPRRHAAVRRLQHVRDRLPGEGDRDRGRLRPERRGPSEVSDPLRDRLLALHLLRPLRRGVPRGRDPDGQGSAVAAVGQPPRDVARPRRAALVAAAVATSPSRIRRRPPRPRPGGRRDRRPAADGRHAAAPRSAPSARSPARR